MNYARTLMWMVTHFFCFQYWHKTAEKQQQSFQETPIFFLLRYLFFFFPCWFGSFFWRDFLPAASLGSNILPVKQLRAKYPSHHLHANPVLVCMLWNGRRLTTVPRHRRGVWHSIFTENHPERVGTTLAEPFATQGPMTLLMHLCA